MSEIDPRELAAEKEMIAEASGPFIRSVVEREVALTARLREMAAMLRRLEWRDAFAWSDEPYYVCPICHQAKPLGHAPDCELAALLAASPGAAGTTEGGRSDG